MGGGLFAEENIVTGKFVVSFSAEYNQKAWIVKALEQNIYNDLSGYGRIIPFNKVKDEDQHCKNREIDCILEIYKKLNVDALMLGKVDDSDIDYEIYDIQNESLIKTGSIDIGSGSSLLKLRMEAFAAFKSFIEKGGILDKRKYNSLADIKANETNDQIVQEKPNNKPNILVLLSLAGFTCFPYLLSLFGKPRKHPERSKIVLRWFFPFQLVCLSVIGYQYALEANGSSSNIINTILSFFDGHYWILSGLGGIAWGCFFVLHYKIVMPNLQGIERIKPNNLFPLLQSCVLTIIIKTLVIATFYFGYFYGILMYGKHFSINQEIIVILLLPISGLYIFYWIALILDVFSMSIDVELSQGKLDFNNVWNMKVRKYFISYLKRNGVTLSKRVVDNIVFLPGDIQGVVCYGGGFSRPRITIEKDLIKYALGDIDEFKPEETGVYSRRFFAPVRRQHSVFRIFANISPHRTRKYFFKSKHYLKKVKYLENVQNFYERDLNLQDIKRNDQIDNFMQGIVFPKLEGKDDFPSLMSDNLDDMQVVEELLLENSLGNHRYDEDAEIDDSNEHDKDFLFGAILHKFGELLRHEDVFSTTYLYFRRTKRPKENSRNVLFSKHFSIVADTFVVLNFGLNHLMQHLFYLATNNSSHLTTVGTNSLILKSQDNILTSVKKATEDEEPKNTLTDELNRIIWLSKFCQDPIEHHEQNNIRARSIFKWAFFLGVVYIMTSVIINSYSYHPKYSEIIEKEKLEIAHAIKNKLERERKKK